jgi:dihydroorotase
MPVPDEIRIPEIADFHIHLRQGDMMQAVTSHLKSAGVGLVYVMVEWTLNN